VIATVHEVGPRLGVQAACAAIGLSRATYYRHRPGAPKMAKPTAKRSTPKRALTIVERQEVLDVLHEPRFVDLPPTEVYAQLLDEDRYYCAIRTMYRILASAQEVCERRRQRIHPPYAKPELIATAPNQVWSWDITKLLGPEKWTYYYLYVLLDIFSRYVVGWLVAGVESAALAKKLIAESCAREAIEPDQLTIHSDRGPPMRSRTLAQTFAMLGVTKSFSRPHVSDDNPFSEAGFKTLKHHLDYPGRFADVTHAEHYCGDFFPWYNHEHHHSALGLMTPYDIHSGRALEKWMRRAKALEAAYFAHPERFPHGMPTPPPLPIAAYINKPKEIIATTEPTTANLIQPAQ